MTDGTVSPRDPWRREDGHLTDEAIVALGDAQDALLSAEAIGHVAGCEACTVRAGEAARLSARLGPLVEVAVRRRPARVAATFPLPAWSLAAAFFLAGAGLVPWIADAVGRVPALASEAGRTLPVLARCATVAARAALADAGTGGGAVPIALSAGSVVVLVMLGLWVARSASRAPGGRVSQRGEVG